MPKILPYIDEIVREIRQDALVLSFSGSREFSKFPFERNPIRRRILQWLGENDIAHRACGPLSNSYRMEGYRGNIFIDIPLRPVGLALRALVKFLKKLQDEYGIDAVQAEIFEYSYCKDLDTLCNDFDW